MTPSERAEKIAQKLSELFSEGDRAEIVPLIASEIQEAVEEAESRGYERCRIDLVAIQSSKWTKEVKREAYEEAAKVAEDYDCDNDHGRLCEKLEIANAIRALKEKV